jgi:hypothetical protein
MRRGTATKAKATDQQALAVLYGKYRKYGNECFALDRGPERAALIVAIDRGWLWGWEDRVRVTAEGVSALAPWLEGVPS